MKQQYDRGTMTHLTLNKMSGISQTISLDAFSWMKNFVFWLKFHWNLFLKVQMTLIQHWLPMLTRFTDASMRHKGEMSFNGSSRKSRHIDNTLRSFYVSHWEHDDVIKWKNFQRNRPFVRGIHRSPVNSPHKSQWRGALVFSLICVWINDWVNNREAGDLRRYRAHYDVILMRFLWYAN